MRCVGGILGSVARSQFRSKAHFHFQSGRSFQKNPFLVQNISSSVIHTRCLSNIDLEKMPEPFTDFSKSVEVGATRWVRLETITFTDQEGKERKWDRAVRTTKQSETSIGLSVCSCSERMLLR